MPPTTKLKLQPKNKNTKLNSNVLWGPSNGAIASQITRLTQDTIIEITRQADKYTISDFHRMLEVDPTSKACLELKALRATITLGNYTNQDKEAQEWVKGNFDEMSGALSTAVGQLCSSMAIGFAVAEINFTNKSPGRWGEWRLESINILDPTKITFRGSKGKISEVVYNEGGKKKFIPYRKVLHVINGFANTFNEPYGSAECRRAFPYFKAKQLMLAELTVAAKNQATGLLTGFADSNDTVRLLDSEGKTKKNPDGSDKIVSAVESLFYQLQNLENSNVIVTDLKNRIAPMQLPTGENFFNISLQYLDRQIMKSFGVSALTFDEGSGNALGNSGLSQNHRSVLDSQIEAIVGQLRDKLIENVIRPLLVANFGIKYSRQLGSFSMQPYSDPMLILQKGNFLMQAMSSGLIPSSDMSAMNTLREFAGIAPISEEEQQALVTAQAQAQQAAMAAAGQVPAPTPEIPTDPGNQYPS